MLFFGSSSSIPIVYAIYISRYDWGVLGKIEPVGWENYRELLHDELFRLAVRNGLKYTLVVVPSQMALGLSWRWS